MRKLLICFLCVLGCMSCTQLKNTKINEKDKQVWMNPFNILSTEPVSFSSGGWELSDLAQWTKTQKGLDVIYIYIDAITNRTVTDAQIEDFCDMLKKTNKELAIELAGLCNWYQSSYQPGTDDFANQSVYGERGEFYRLRKFRDALTKRGLKISYLNFDHPFMRAMNPTYENVSPKMSIKEAAEQLYLSMAMWQKECPGIKFNYVVNFPNHGWKGGAPVTGSPIPEFSEYFFGDFYDDFKEICRLNETSGIRMNAIVVDFPYNPYLNSDMAFPKSEKTDRIRDLEKETKDAGMKFGIIFNSEDEGMGRNGAGNRQYYSASLEFVDYYVLNGGEPDFFINESWYQNPDKLLPEDEPYTIANLTLEMIKRVKK